MAMRERIRAYIKKISAYNRISHSDEIGRRYFAMNAFDGILTTRGILFGSYAGNIREPHVVFITGMGAAVAMGVSGFWGAYETERAERSRDLKELEDATLRSLADTEISRAGDFAVWTASIIDGVSPFAAAMLVIFPFFLPLSIERMYLSATVLALLSLAALGAYLGSLSKKSMTKGALKMVLAGVISAAISVLLIGKAV